MCRLEVWTSSSHFRSGGPQRSWPSLPCCPLWSLHRLCLPQHPAAASPEARENKNKKVGMQLDAQYLICNTLHSIGIIFQSHQWHHSVGCSSNDITTLVAVVDLSLYIFKAFILPQAWPQDQQARLPWPLRQACCQMVHAQPVSA